MLTAQAAGQANRKTPDEEILAFAVSLKRALITFNRGHFVRLHARIATHSGIIVCSRDPGIVGLASRIHQAIAKRTTLERLLIRINRPHRP